MYYTIICEDVADSLGKRLSARPNHLARLEVLRNEGRLLTAGPNPRIDSESPGSEGFSGSVIIAEFDTLEDAQSWANTDPFVIAGVYEKVTIKPYKKVF